MARFALILGQQNAYLYRLGAKAATLQQAAPLADAAPRDWLAQEVPKGAHCTVLTDFLDEAYTLSALPPIWLPSARAQLLERRLNNQYRGATLRAAIVPRGQGFKPPVMASLFNLGQVEVVNLWVNALEQLEARVDGVFTFASLVACAFAPRARAGQPPQLLVVETPSGLRQVAIVDGAPVFSRLALQPNAAEFDYAAACTETQRTAQYLFSQSWLPGSAQPVDTRLWLHQPPPDDLALPQRVDALQVVAVHAHADTYGLALAHVRRLPMVQQLLPLDRLLRARAHQMGQGALVVSGALLAFAVGWAGLTVRDVLSAQARTQRDTLSAAQLEENARKEVLQAVGDVNNASLAEASVAAWRAGVSQQPDPLGALTHLSAALAQVPAVSLMTVAWQARDPWQDPNAAAPAEPFGCDPVVQEAAPVDPAAVAPPAPKPAQVVVRFAGALTADLSPRAAVDAQGKLREALQQSGWRVSTRLPAFDTDRTRALTGAVGLAPARPIEHCMEESAP